MPKFILPRIFLGGWDKEKNRHHETQLSLWMAFIFCMASLGVGCFLVFLGYEKIGFCLLGGTLIGVVGAFLPKRRKD